MATPESQARENALATSPFVDELDPCVAATDLIGLKLPPKLSDRITWERRHRNVFHFRYARESTSGDLRKDFKHWNSPTLAYAGPRLLRAEQEGVWVGAAAGREPRDPV